MLEKEMLALSEEQTRIFLAVAALAFVTSSTVWSGVLSTKNVDITVLFSIFLVTAILLGLYLFCMTIAFAPMESPGGKKLRDSFKNASHTLYSTGISFAILYLLLFVALKLFVKFQEISGLIDFRTVVIVFLIIILLILSIIIYRLEKRLKGCEAKK